MDVVDVAVVVVVNPVARDLAGIGPDICRQIRVVVVYARVDHTDHHVARPGEQIPGFGCVDICIRRATSLAGVVHAPQQTVVRIIGRSEDAVQVVGFDIFHERIVGQQRDRLRHGHGGQSFERGADAGKILQTDGIQLAVQGIDLTAGCTVHIFNDHFAWYIRPGNGLGGSQETPRRQKKEENR